MLDVREVVLANKNTPVSTITLRSCQLSIRRDECEYEYEDKQRTSRNCQCALTAKYGLLDHPPGEERARDTHRTQDYLVAVRD